MNEPGCTRYSPNYNYIWPKLITGIKWCDQRGRKVKKVQVFFHHQSQKEKLKNSKKKKSRI